MEKPKQIKVASLWMNTSKSGMQYMTGKLGGLKIVIFPVKEKRSDRSPDFNMYFEEVPYDAAPQAQPPGLPANVPLSGAPLPGTMFDSGFGAGFEEKDLPF